MLPDPLIFYAACFPHEHSLRSEGAVAGVWIDDDGDKHITSPVAWESDRQQMATVACSLNYPWQTQFACELRAF